LWEILQSDACFTGYGVIFFCYSGALELFAELLQRFPNNVHLLTETAKVRDDIDYDANRISPEFFILS